ncbi:hypothetical protein GCM10022278_37030 [Allohahella marinimesophila]|uniref:Uncharacterized protein n=1 Tax=Allohahella marinimesophila TaxID=1054972 RepID=A0ABP7Q543_9GAMM
MSISRAIPGSLFIEDLRMYRINAITSRGTRFRFRITSSHIDDLSNMLDKIFAGTAMHLVLIQPIK